MNKKLFLLGMLAVALTFGLVLLGCDNGGGGGGDGGGSGGGGGATGMLIVFNMSNGNIKVGVTYPLAAGAAGPPREEAFEVNPYSNGSKSLPIGNGYSVKVIHSGGTVGPLNRAITANGTRLEFDLNAQQPFTPVLDSTLSEPTAGQTKTVLTLKNGGVSDSSIVKVQIAEQGDPNKKDVNYNKIAFNATQTWYNLIVDKEYRIRIWVEANNNVIQRDCSIKLLGNNGEITFTGDTFTATNAGDTTVEVEP
ncbi:MAG: hypothetical protein LBP37_02335 [Spirochaetaceae bacterium]|jgi:hypothetical protein|nr:hypothetical protein [Spirochaetaceae bacterium]